MEQKFCRKILISKFVDKRQPQEVDQIFLFWWILSQHVWNFFKLNNIIPSCRKSSLNILSCCTCSSGVYKSYGFEQCSTPTNILLFKETYNQNFSNGIYFSTRYLIMLSGLKQLFCLSAIPGRYLSEIPACTALLKTIVIYRLLNYNRMFKMCFYNQV